jgi:zinc protease
MVRALRGAADVPGAGRRLVVARSARAGLLRWALSGCTISWLSSGQAAADVPGAPAAEASQPRAGTQAAVAAAVAPVESQPSRGVPGLTLRRDRLENGLRVVLHRDPALPTVAIGVAYAVGTGHEGGSRNVGAGEHERRIRDQGGSAGAWTSADRTLFIDVLPAHALALGLWLEADRMKSLELSDSELIWQGRLLELELQQEARDARAHARSELRAQVFSELSVARGPRPVASAAQRIGPTSKERLPALRAFHQRYYAPNNAVLTISGSFEMLTALNLIQTHFADARSVELPPAPGAHPAQQRQPRRVTLPGGADQGPALWQGWPAPPARTAEHDALQLAGLILGAGVGSRLSQLLISEKGLARDVTVWMDGGRGPDLFGVEVQLRDGMDPEQASRLVLAQIAALASFGPSATELKRAQRMLETSTWRNLDGNQALTRALCEAELFAHDARLIEAELTRPRRLEREDVQRAVARYLRPSSRTDVFLQVPRR